MINYKNIRDPKYGNSNEVDVCVFTWSMIRKKMIIIVIKIWALMFLFILLMIFIILYGAF
jgi:hypothetical protein